jgi:hypothetical protein
MTKEFILEKLALTKFPEKKEIGDHIRSLPNQVKFIPRTIKKGDIFWSPGIAHFIVIYKVNKNDCTCFFLTTKTIAGSIPTKSRSLEGNISIALLNNSIEFIKNLPFSGIYDNNSHLNEIYKLIKSKL